jgi:2-phospho-L-lactate guanylyltransferase
VKRLDRAKLRLSQRLAPPDRRRLGLAMLADVLRATDKWSRRLIVTSDQDAEAVGLAFGCELVADPGEGLNAAVAAGTEAAVAGSATTLLVLPSDVPMVTSDDVTALFACPEHVVIAPSHDGGTNALLRRPPGAIRPSFGPGSAALHRTRALENGLECRSVEMSSLVLDIDRYGDLVTLGGLANLRESVRLARELLG